MTSNVIIIIIMMILSILLLELILKIIKVKIQLKNQKQIFIYCFISAFDNNIIIRILFFCIIITHDIDK